MVARLSSRSRTQTRPKLDPSRHVAVCKLLKTGDPGGIGTLFHIPCGRSPARAGTGAARDTGGGHRRFAFLEGEGRTYFTGPLDLPRGAAVTFFVDPAEAPAPPRRPHALDVRLMASGRAACLAEASS